MPTRDKIPYFILPMSSFCIIVATVVGGMCRHFLSPHSEAGILWAGTELPTTLEILFGLVVAAVSYVRKGLEHSHGRKNEAQLQGEEYGSAVELVEKT